MNPPIISVVMSVYNGQTFLAEAVESILGQTFPDFEFVVIDDGSTDRTPEILAAYASRDARIRVFRQENKGRTESLNIGIALAQGKYIARIDADDIALPDRLNAQLEFMEQHPEVGLLGGPVELINTTGQVIRTVTPPLEDAGIKLLMLRYNPIYHSSVLMRKELVLATGGYRMPFDESEDYDLWLRIGERSGLAILDHPIVQYRIHSNQVSVRKLEHQMLCIIAARTAARLRRSGSPDPLSAVDRVTPQLLQNLGVTQAEIHEALLEAYGYWTETLSLADPKASLGGIEDLLRLPEAESFDRSVLANAWLKSAGIHYRGGRPLKALVSTGRAVLLRPMVAVRPVKWAYTRLAAAIRG